jgi:hypothetical protein
VRDEVASTLEAALADPASADAVRSGGSCARCRTPASAGVDLPARSAGRSRRAGRSRGREAAAQDDRAARCGRRGRGAGGRRAARRPWCGPASRSSGSGRGEEAAEQAHEEVERLRQALQEAEALRTRPTSSARRGAGEPKAVDAVRKAQRRRSRRAPSWTGCAGASGG